MYHGKMHIYVWKKSTKSKERLACACDMHYIIFCLCSFCFNLRGIVNCNKRRDISFFKLILLFCQLNACIHSIGKSFNFKSSSSSLLARLQYPQPFNVCNQGIDSNFSFSLFICPTVDNSSGSLCD